MMTFKADQYLKDFTFYTSNDRRFRFVRDRVLGPEKYNNIMDSMLDAADFDRRTTGRQLWMTEAMLRELANDGHIIGLHSHTHPTNLAALDRNDQLTEYQKSKARLTEIIGSEPITMSHPCNSYNRDTIDVLKELGIKIGFRANMAMTEVPSDFELPREDHANILKLVEPI
jgi:peptidoglycan/xylan/chitin deacetylase (PgdA/CDA1 family)